MEIKIESKHILGMLNILSWVIFIGLCIEAGGILFNAAYAVYKPIVAKYFWNGADLSDLLAHDKGRFIVQTFLMVIVSVLKALVFYLIVKLFYNKKLSLSKPFHADVTRTVNNIAYLCLGSGLFSLWGVRHAAWLETQGVKMPDMHYLRIDGADVWFFMAVVLIVIGQVFKKGTELQTESELTV